MDIIQFITLFATMLTGFGFIYRELKNIEKDIREDVKIQSARADQLYTMFIDLLKSK